MIDELIEKYPYAMAIVAAIIIAVAMLWNETTKYHSPEKKAAVVKNKRGETIWMIVGLSLLGFFGVFIQKCAGAI